MKYFKLNISFFTLLLLLNLSSCNLFQNPETYNCGSKQQSNDIINSTNFPKEPLTILSDGKITFRLNYRYDFICSQEKVNIALSGSFNGTIEKPISIKAYAEWGGTNQQNLNLKRVNPTSGTLNDYNSVSTIDMNRSNPNDQFGPSAVNLYIEFTFISSKNYKTDLDYLKSKFLQLNIIVDYYKHL